MGTVGQTSSVDPNGAGSAVLAALKQYFTEEMRPCGYNRGVVTALATGASTHDTPVAFFS